MSEKWKLKRTTQCKSCPWKKDVDPHDIPDGYSVDKHCALKSTIADTDSPLAGAFGRTMRVMACHEEHQSHCIGWLMNQLGPGNNLGLRMRMRHCENVMDIHLVGEQHERFEDTLPERDEL